MSEEEGTFLDDIPAELPVHLETTREKRFAPWHRVHKQIIREQQWNEAIRNLVRRDLRKHFRKEELVPSEELPTGVTDALEDQQGLVAVPLPLKCLMIPGDDLLDVRSLHTALKDESCHIRFLGFNSSKSRGGSEIRESEVRALSMIRKDSQVLPDSFQSLASKKSIAHQQLSRYGPYEVVNLDLCDVLVPRGNEKATTSYYTAIWELLIYQFREQTNPWLLFITTHIDLAIADQAGLDKLAGPIRDNCDRHIEFATAFEQIVPKAAFTGAKKLDLSSMTSEQLVRSFGIVLGKWMMNLCERSRPQWTVSLQSSYRYTVRADKGAAMLSLGFKFKRRVVAPMDLTGLAKPTTDGTPTAVPSEFDLAMRMTKAAMAIQDPDELLKGDSELRERMVNASADLLTEAGYSRVDYLKWVEGGEGNAA